jgi:DNA-binding beta-propeller fold protein YncE
VLVTVRDDDALVVLDADGAPVGDPVPVGDAPVSVAVSADGTRVYVVSQRSNDLTVLTVAEG